jgi:hypothetical protein
MMFSFDPIYKSRFRVRNNERLHWRGLVEFIARGRVHFPVGRDMDAEE